MSLIQLPPQVTENNLIEFTESLSVASSAKQAILDFKLVRWYTPAAIVAIVSRIKHWESEGISWQFINWERNPTFRYFQRMDVCNVLNWKIPENFVRNNPGSNFVPLKEIKMNGPTQEVAKEISKCLDPSLDELYRLMSYSSEEMMLNVTQHSESHGYITAQYAPATNLVRLGVADYGRGILASFRDRAAKHYTPGMSDLDAMRLAVKPQISSTTHLSYGPYGRSPNAGVGLSMASELVRQTYGEMILISGAAVYRRRGNNDPEFSALNVPFHGTLVSLTFSRTAIADFYSLVKDARIALGLQPPDSQNNLFLEDNT